MTTPTSALLRAFIVSSFAAIAGACGSARPRDDAFDKARMEAVLARGDDATLREAFRREPGHTLPFVDQYLEGALKMTEKDGPTAASRALESYRTGMRFAKLADETFAETIFSEYARSFAGWSSADQKKFREGQRLFKAGMAAGKEKPAEGLKVLRESLQRAEELGDWWGQAMAHGGIAETALAAGGDEHLELALEAAGRAVQLNTRLRLLEDVVAAHLVRASVLERREPQSALGPLREAWTIARSDRSIPPELRATAKGRLLRALDGAGMREEAEKVRVASGSQRP